MQLKLNKFKFKNNSHNNYRHQGNMDKFLTKAAVKPEATIVKSEATVSSVAAPTLTATANVNVIVNTKATESAIASPPIKQEDSTSSNTNAPVSLPVPLVSSVSLPPSFSESGSASTILEALTTFDHVKLVSTLRTQHELPALKEFFAKCSSYTAAAIVEEARKNVVKSSSTSGEVYLKLEGTQLIEPRGKYDVSISSGGLLVEGKVSKNYLALKTLFFLFNSFFPSCRLGIVLCPSPARRMCVSSPAAPRQKKRAKTISQSD